MTSRITGFLPGPLWLWILLLAAVVPLRPVINGLILRYAGAPAAGDEILARALAHIFLGLIVALCLAGSHLLWRDATTAQAAVDRIDRPDGMRAPVFSGLGSTFGPIAVAVLLTLVSEASNLGRYPLLVTSSTRRCSCSWRCR